MLEWIWRGIRIGKVTTAYPKRPEPAPPRLRGRLAILDAESADASIEEVCPTRAISVTGSTVSVDRARCILCGLCVETAPDRFAFEPRHETASRRREGLWIGQDGHEETDDTGESLASQASALRRSVHIRHVDAGSDGSEEWEITALTNPRYDMQRLGLFFTAAPRHADILLVTGVGTRSMRTPLLRTWEVMPYPKAVVAVGSDACSGGLAEGSIGAAGIAAILPVDVYVPGSPPTPIAILHGLLLAAGIVNEEFA